jgi:hypothetical protein
MKRNGLVLLFMCVALAGMLIPQASHAQSRTRCFDETGYCVSGAILDYWERNGGLAVFGYPITNLRTETVEGVWTGPVQWFQRDRLEDHGAEGVLAGRLGASILELQNRPWTTFPQIDRAPRGCRYFAETGHSVCQPFIGYWERNGGLMRFGYPITEPMTETIGDWSGTVQYFERRRMEHHLENRGTQYEVLLGLLGKDVLNFGQAPTPCQTPVAETLRSAYDRIEGFRDQMGCPGAVLTDRPASIQNFERGVMIWTDLGNGDRRIYAYVYGYRQYTDTWQEGEPDTPNVTAPSGLYPPRRGFGKVWINDPSLRSDIGWAVEQFERAEKVTAQVFDKGIMIKLQNANTVYVFGPDRWNAQIITP